MLPTTTSREGAVTRSCCSMESFKMIELTVVDFIVIISFPVSTGSFCSSFPSSSASSDCCLLFASFSFLFIIVLYIMYHILYIGWHLWPVLAEGGARWWFGASYLSELPLFGLEAIPRYLDWGVVHVVVSHPHLLTLLEPDQQRHFVWIELIHFDSWASKKNYYWETGGHFVPKPLVEGFGCLELVLYGRRKLV